MFSFDDSFGIRPFPFLGEPELGIMKIHKTQLDDDGVLSVEFSSDEETRMQLTASSNKAVLANSTYPPHKTHVIRVPFGCVAVLTSGAETKTFDPKVFKIKGAAQGRFPGISLGI